MKILQLRFKNLNSLVGEWAIDFTAAEYLADGIFAITGPTGAGKSTILDAICLALYGKTPRLDKVNKTTNEIMSRQTGECFAEIVFSTQAGIFSCHWGQHRARKKPGAKLADQRHEIADVSSGQIIESKKSNVPKVVAEVTGMDFQQFTRSILLAQGGFDTFLKAAGDKRSPILEQITGTEIYSTISQRVHERWRDERENLNLLQAETSSIVTLEPEQEKEIEQNLEAKQKQGTELVAKSTETGKAITWLATTEGLQREIDSLTDEAAKLQTEVETFKPKRGKLEQAVRAASLDGTYASLTALRKQQSEDQAALKKEDAAFPELETSTNTQAEALKSTEQLTLKTKENLKSAAPLIQKIRSLDQQITDRAKAVSEGDETCSREAAKIETDRQTWVKEQEKRTGAGRSLELAEQYLKEHAQDEWLISGLAGIEEQFGNLLARQGEITQKETDLKNAATAMVEAAKKLEDTTKQSAIRRQKLEDAAGNLRQGKDTLSELLGDNLLREYRTEKETLLREIAYIRKIEELEDHRAKLEDGKPCPLCGSTEHPFAEGNVPVPDENEQKIELLTRLISRAEDQEAIVKKLEEAQTTARRDLENSEKLESNVANDKRAVEKDFTELQGGLEKFRSGFKELKLAVSGKLQPLGITEIPEAQVSSLLESLKSRQKKWQEQVWQKSDIEKQIATINSEMKRLTAVIEIQSAALNEKQENLKRLQREHADGTDQRKKLYGDKNPADQEGRLNEAIADAEKAEKRARSLNSGLQEKLTTARAHVESLGKRIEQREPDLKKAETDFSTALEPAGFAEEKQFLEARLTNNEREALSYRARKLDDAGTELKGRQKDRETRLASEIAKKLTDKSLEELEAQFKEYGESLKELGDAIAGFRHRLNENRAIKERIKEKQPAIEAQKKECGRWDLLHELIGSADGKKYRDFAQGLTFELMVHQANRQLVKMTDRYLLIRDAEKPLELQVVDNYQGGDLRSTKNLSGGESFIVSLALALGLSSMASRKVRVDSLFLDEGFGTLDDDALEVALETLAGLRQEDKLIGVISHVPALKERIATQIQVMPLSGGRSSIQGPGCRLL
ncbi:AAA family ATPase [Desulfotalea psychrophila]|uniref:Related to ATP-dependent dsDNA exonuclease (SBCC) n=1 Tax=Desulfotalea psychrophila (strain LSv54 / DSM 12343) TaxID=177439 RepID=Q6AQW9_DESPS|nr:AAA family ATPase [Desulfotalea psychrophila]CAG35255.1 related to ATP-dependent dsDNA exonuclease (SBCC) [Desulfotalea psychrophila LSv54]